MGVKEEAFAPVLVAVELDTGAEPRAFLKEVLRYVNNDVFGRFLCGEYLSNESSLSCNVIVHPKTEKELKDEFENFIAQLEWGTISINEYAMLASLFGVCPWGAYPKHKPEDIQSGEVVLNVKVINIFRAKLVMLDCM